MVKKILVSQPKPASEKSPYFDIEKEFGMECVFRTFFKIDLQQRNSVSRRLIC